MNFVEEFFHNNRDELFEKLQGVGITAEQADGFLAEAASAIARSFYHKDIETIIGAMNIDDPSQLVQAVNIKPIVQNTGADASLVTAGVVNIAPLIVQAFVENNEGVIVTAASIAWGDRLNFGKRPDA